MYPMIQEGGALRGQGVFGCIFDPAPPCAGGNVFKTISGKKAVGKVTSEDIEDELGIGKVIMALPLAAQYFALPSASCKAGTSIDDPEAKGCRVLKEAKRDTVFSLLIMPEAGEQLYKWSQNLRRLGENYERLFRHLLEGMVIYQGAGYIHNDIHMGNVLLDENDVARYIDFGLGFRLADIKKWDDTNMGKRFRPKYSWQAPEIHAWRMARNKIWLTDGLKQLNALIPEYARLEHQYPNRLSAHDAFKAIIDTIPKASGKFIHLYAKKFDCWRIGFCMWHLWDDLVKGLAVPANIDKDKIRRILGGLTDFDPRSRLSAAEALYILDPNSRFSDQRRRVPAAPTPTAV